MNMTRFLGQALFFFYFSIASAFAAGGADISGGGDTLVPRLMLGQRLSLETVQKIIRLKNVNDQTIREYYKIRPDLLRKLNQISAMKIKKVARKDADANQESLRVDWDSGEIFVIPEEAGKIYFSEIDAVILFLSEAIKKTTYQSDGARAGDLLYALAEETARLKLTQAIYPCEVAQYINKANYIFVKYAHSSKVILMDVRVPIESFANDSIHYFESSYYSFLFLEFRHALRSYLFQQSVGIRAEFSGPIEDISSKIQENAFLESIPRNFTELPAFYDQIWSDLVKRDDSNTQDQYVKRRPALSLGEILKKYELLSINDPRVSGAVMMVSDDLFIRAYDSSVIALFRETLPQVLDATSRTASLPENDAVFQTVKNARLNEVIDASTPKFVFDELYDPETREVVAALAISTSDDKEILISLDYFKQHSLTREQAFVILFHEIGHLSGIRDHAVLEKTGLELLKNQRK